MPIIRKIVKMGNSFAVFIPKSWLTYYEEETGQKISKVAIEVNHVLKIEPVLEKTEQQKTWLTHAQP